MNTDEQLNGQFDFEVVIAGGGATGLSAALVPGRPRRRVAAVDAGTPGHSRCEVAEAAFVSGELVSV